MSGIDDGALRCDHFDRFHQACTRRDVTANQTTEDIRDGRGGNCFDSVDGPSNLRGAAGEIDARAFALDRHAGANWDFILAYPIVVQGILSFISAVGNCPDSMAHYAR